MTREEAIEANKNLLEYMKITNKQEPDCQFSQDNISALDMEIKVLEQEPFINKPCISKGVCNEDKIKVLDKISAEIERQDNWLMMAGYNAYNVDIAFNSIKKVLKEARDEE